jgi:glutamine synthetase
MSIIKAEYIWIDGTEPTPLLRSKTRMLEANIIEKVLGAITGVAALPTWGFDGSSTNQATGDDSDCQLFPVFACRDPLRGGDNLLVLCEVVTHGGTPHRATHVAQPRKSRSVSRPSIAGMAWSKSTR